MKLNFFQKILLTFSFVGFMCVLNFWSLDREIAIDYLKGTIVLIVALVVSVLGGKINQK